MKFFSELRRRNVVRVGLAYVVGAWVILQIVDFGLDAISAPNWIMQMFILLAAVGFPVVLIVTWVFELTPEGIRRESEIDRTQSISAPTGRRLDRVIIAFLAVAVLLLFGERFFVGPDDTAPVVTGDTDAIVTAASRNTSPMESPKKFSIAWRVSGRYRSLQEHLFFPSRVRIRTFERLPSNWGWKQSLKVVCVEQGTIYGSPLS